MTAPAPNTPARGAAAAFVGAVLLCAAAGCTAGSGEAADPVPESASASSGPSGSTSSSQDPATEEQSMSENESQSDRDAITANYLARQRAMVDGDTAELRRLLIPDSHAEHISGYNQPRDEWFDQIESGYFDYHTIDNNSMTITPTGSDRATLVSSSTIDVTIGDSRSRWQLDSTAEYLKVDGRWLSGDSQSQMQ